MNAPEILERLDDILNSRAYDTYEGVVMELENFRDELDREIRLNPEVYICPTPCKP